MSKRIQMKPFISVIDGKLKTGKTDIKHIRIEYEPSRTRAGVEWLPQLIPVKINGKKRLKRHSAIEWEHKL